MATSAQTAMAQWQRIEALVQEWLRERQELLYLISTIRSASNRTQPPLRMTKRIHQLCELLMDYISAGYFEIYRELAREARCFERDSQALTRSIMQRLEDSTDEALAFNDDFESVEQIEKLYASLPERLSDLLEKLEERFALEDQLIVSIHQKDVPAPQIVH